MVEEEPIDGESAGNSEKGKPLWWATCTECHKKCTVPFIPRKGKPVRCYTCWKKYKYGND